MASADDGFAARGSTTTRYLYMDSLRATLIVGGILFHAALPYRSTGTWNVVDTSRHVTFDLVSEAVASFRMPTFFFVAGFFCALTFAGREATTNLRRRLTVFGIPFLACAATIQPIQYALRVSGGDVLHALAPMHSTAFWHAYLAAGAFVSHLWFLINLVVYYCLVYLLIRLVEPRGQLRNRFGRWRSAIPTWILASKATVAPLCVIAILPIYFALSHLPQIPGYGFEDLALYSPFFLAGYVCFSDERSMLALGKVGVLDLVVLGVGVAVSFSGIVTNHFAAAIFDFWLFYQSAWTLGMLALSAFRKWFDVRSDAMRAVSDASYSIYLFHHLFVIVFAGALLSVDLPGAPWTKYVLVVVSTFLATFLLHHRVIRRHKWLSLVFNGR